LTQVVSSLRFAIMPTLRRTASARTYSGAFIGCLIAMAISGCQRPAQPTQPTAEVIQEQDVQPLWDASLNVLRKFDFQPDRQDRAMGVITTLPTTSAQWGEFWRQDVADPYSLAESSLHTIQRQVTVRFIRDGSRQLEVQVDVYRLSAAESQITTASSAIQSFSGVLPDTQGGYHGQTKGTRDWVLLGRDAAMEARLLKRIVAQAGTGSAT
jgi:hypothetical protein